MSYYSVFKNGEKVNTIVCDQDFANSLVASGAADSVELDIDPPREPEPQIKFYSEEEFRSAMTILERVKWDNNDKPSVVTVKLDLQNRQVNDTNVVDYCDILVSDGIISTDTKTKIVTGDAG